MRVPKPIARPIPAGMLRETIKRSRELQERSRLLREEATVACGATDDLLHTSEIRIDPDTFWR